MAENKTTVRITWLYGDLMNLYGSAGNMSSLMRLLEAMGAVVELQELSVGGYSDFSGSDFIFLGSGTERRALMALEDIRRFKDQIARCLEAGGTLLATGTGSALFGRSIKGLDGGLREGLGFAAGSTEFYEKRRYGEYVMSCPLAGEPVVGCINTSSSVRWEEQPLFEVLHRTGDGPEGPEGALKGGLMLTQLQGPLLWRNPPLLEALARKLSGLPLPECRPLWLKEACSGYQRLLRQLTPPPEKAKNA